MLFLQFKFKKCIQLLKKENLASFGSHKISSNKDTLSNANKNKPPSITYQETQICFPENGTQLPKHPTALGPCLSHTMSIWIDTAK